MFSLDKNIIIIKKSNPLLVAFLVDLKVIFINYN
jgi:hypothetical protein